MKDPARTCEPYTRTHKQATPSAVYHLVTTALLWTAAFAVIVGLLLLPFHPVLGLILIGAAGLYIVMAGGAS